MQLTPEEIAEQQRNEENTKKKYITPIIQLKKICVAPLSA